MVKHYAELVAWQKAMELAAMVYTLTKGLPDSERFGLTTQMQRAAVSVPSNIAEGHERRSTGDYRRFLAIASGSLAELETQLRLCQMVGYVNESAIGDVLAHASEVGRIIRGIDRQLKRATP
jgi:four helix bundle protein